MAQGRGVHRPNKSHIETPEQHRLTAFSDNPVQVLTDNAFIMSFIKLFLSHNFLVIFYY